MAGEAIRRAELAALRARLQALPASQREAMVLREWHGLAYDEIARATGDDAQRGGVAAGARPPRARSARASRQARGATTSSSASGAGALPKNDPRYTVSAAAPVTISIIVAVRAPRLWARMSPGGLTKAVETA